jgi:hypothetical protein
MRQTFLKLGFASITALCSSLMACDGKEERYEVIDKLRAIGVSPSPLASAPEGNVTLTFFAALPLGGEVTAANYTDEDSKYALPIALTVDSASAKTDDYNALSVYSIAATFKAPTAEELKISPALGFVRLRYGIILKSGSEEEKIVGNYLVYPKNSPQLDWKTPEIRVAAPTDNAVVSGETDLDGSIEDSLDDSWRVGWFASEGKIKNRRASVTTWETDSAGSQSVIFTARGLRTGAFMFKVIDVNVE